MGRSVIDFPVSTVAAVLQNLDNFGIWNRYMTVSQSLSSLVPRPSSSVIERRIEK